MSVIISAYSKAAFNEFLNQVYSVIKVHSSFVQVGLAICKENVFTFEGGFPIGGFLVSKERRERKKKWQKGD